MPITIVSSTFLLRQATSAEMSAAMAQGVVTVAYIAAAILFILSLGGLSNPETSRRGNLYGMIGMALAVLATVFGPQVTPAGYAWIVAALVLLCTALPLTGQTRT